MVLYHDLTLLILEPQYSIIKRYYFGSKMKKQLKIKAIELRKVGLSYNEIQKKISVSKSTLSLWLRNINLQKKQKEILQQKRDLARKKGLNSILRNKIIKKKEIIKEAENEILRLSNNEIFMMGAMLYWAEGAKEKEFKPGQGVIFSNSDAKMIAFFLLWLKKCTQTSDDKIQCDIYIHENWRNKIEAVKTYWSKRTGISKDKFVKIYYKKNLISSLRRNKSNGYHGLLRVRVLKSSALNRKIQGWINGICKQCGIV